MVVVHKTMLNQLIKFITGIFFFIYPVFFLTLTSESYDYNKMVLLIITVTILFFLYSLKIVKERKIIFYGSSFTILLSFITGFYIISTLFQSPNITVALTTPLSTSTIVAGFMFYLLLIQMIKHSEKEYFTGISVISVILISLFSISLYIGILPKSLFTPVGTLISTAVYLSVISVYLASKLIIKIVKNPDNAVFDNKDLFYAISLFIILCALILLLIHLSTDQKPILLPLGFGWMILLEILKNIKTMFLGVGPSNFITAFVLAKPLIFNQSPVWNIIFTSSSSFFLNMATEVGIIPALFYLVILFKSVRFISRDNQLTTDNTSTTFGVNQHTSTYDHFPFIITLIFSLLIQMFLPTSMNLYIFTIILLAFASSRQIVIETDLSRLKLGSYFLLLPSIVFMCLILYFGGKVYLAEIYFKQSLNAIVNNQGSEAYNLEQKAISLNPYLDRYRLAISQLSLAIVNSISNKTTISEEDKQNIPRLIQQAIDQGRNAVVLYRTNVVNWDNLARTYASITNYAKDSDQWAIASYQQRLVLDPYNPLTRLALGGFYLYLNRWQDAENIFREAVSLKPDFPNSHYNLGFTLRQEKKYEESYKELQIALSLVTPDSTDSAKIKEELKLIPEKFGTGSGQMMKEGNITSQNEPIDTSSPAALRNISNILPTINLPKPPITQD